MSDDILVAYERVLDLVGMDVWVKLSDSLRAKILDAELASLAAERDLTPIFVTTGLREPL